MKKTDFYLHALKEASTVITESIQRFPSLQDKDEGRKARKFAHNISTEIADGLIALKAVNKNMKEKIYGDVMNIFSQNIVSISKTSGAKPLPGPKDDEPKKSLINKVSGWVGGMDNSTPQA